MATLKDIAAACGVSVASVSKALNHAPDIGTETAERIRQTAQELGYHPNAAARALRTRKTYNVGVLFEDNAHRGLTHEFFSQVLNAVKNGLEERGYDVTFVSQNVGPTRRSYLEHCQYRDFDGVVIANVEFEDPSVGELVRSGIPLVTVDYVFDNVGAVLSDNVRGVRDLVQYMYDLGHRRIAFICGDDNTVTRTRLASFHKTCRELGLAIPDDYVRSAAYHQPKQSGLATRELLALKEPPTCILYPDDMALLGGQTEIESQGLRIPEDISIAGYDGIWLCQMLRPRLTTLKQDCEAMGNTAAQMLVEAMEFPKTYLPRQVLIPGHLIPGETAKHI